MVVLQLRQINVPPGHRVEFSDVPWSEFEAMLVELGERRSSRHQVVRGFRQWVREQIVC